jgi:hypothetical protein
MSLARERRCDGAPDGRQDGVIVERYPAIAGNAQVTPQRVEIRGIRFRAHFLVEIG